MSDRLIRVLFLTVVVICALSIALLSVGLTRQSAVACSAANRALTSEVKVWTRVERATEADWKKHPPTKALRRQTLDFFAGVKDDLKPANC